MKLMMECRKCYKQAKQQGKKQTTYCDVEVTDHGVYHLKCPHGHDSIVLLHDHVYTLLMESGAFALMDGYAREAVSSFASAVERFYEYITKVLATAHGVPPGEIKAFWKSVKSQSERQLGAFRMAFMMEFKKAPPVMNQKDVEFRNDVIHKGHFASRADALNYGQQCINHIIHILDMVTAKHANGAQKAFDMSLYEERMATAKGKQDLQMVQGTVLATRNYLFGRDPYTLEEWITQQEKKRDLANRKR
jgi:hypothetical protein